MEKCIETKPLGTSRAVSVDNDHNQTVNTSSSSTPLMVTPLTTVKPFTSSDDVCYVTHTTATPLMVTPLTTVRPYTSSDNVNDVTHNTSTAPLMAIPLATVRPFTSSDDVTHNAATAPPPPPLIATPLATVRPFTSSDDVTNNTATPPPLVATPLRTIRPSDDTSNYCYSVDAGSSSAGPSADPIKRGRGRPKGSKNKNPTPTAKKPRTYDPTSKVVASYPNFNSGITEEERETGSQEIVDLVLIRFDAVKRRLSQLGVSGVLTTALTNCRNLGVRTNLKKRIGRVPGIQVGHIFYFWGEMCLVGLHTQMVAGIDYLTGSPEGTLATSVVTSGHYDDESHDLDTLVYTGHGGTDKNGEARDQKLERGNLALEESRKKGNEVRVIRGEEDPSDNKKKIYLYDGLYTVTEHWKAKGKSGFDEFKFKLVRKPGQPSGYATWKSVDNWKKNGLVNSREGLITEDLSHGRESLPVPVVNEVDTNVLEDFVYTRSLVFSSMVLDVKTDRRTIGCHDCQGRSCFTEDANCACVRRNGGELPYHNGILVCRRASMYECGQSCPCVFDCSNRVLQMGLKLRVEVFKTENCGWGLRSWEPIRAGTFICEFAGLTKTKEEIEHQDDDDYVFDSSRVYYNLHKWNYEPELVGDDPWEQVSEVFNLPSQVLISAKRHGNVGRFLNHSCSPNVLWQPVGYELNGESYFRIGFFAMKHIPPLAELRYDYGASRETEEVGEDGKPVFKGKEACLCGSLNCRGSFG